MNDKLDIYFSKVFCRMRHKTQLYNGAVFDHFHTRLQHSLEVEEIALLMAKKLISYGATCDLELVSKISLLHDIGHTPFGHAGERTLHDIVSGQLNKGDLPDFKKLGLQIGFKHNINSGLLYVEEAGFHNVNQDLLEGLIKHTKLQFKENDGLDYGFGFVTNGYEISYDNKFQRIEGFIVAYADEIAQICSDYLDINLDFYDNNGRGVDFKSRPYSQLASKGENNYREIAKEAAGVLIDLFCSCCDYSSKEFVFSNNEFLDVVKEFDDERDAFIKSNEAIDNYDKEKISIIYDLFSYYFRNPVEMTADFFADFIKRVKRTHYNTGAMRKFSDDLKYENLNSKAAIANIIEKKFDFVSSPSFDPQKRYGKDCIIFLRTYIRSIAVYISKMTDNYADRKYNNLQKDVDNKG